MSHSTGDETEGYALPRTLAVGAISALDHVRVAHGENEVSCTVATFAQWTGASPNWIVRLASQTVESPGYIGGGVTMSFDPTAFGGGILTFSRVH